MTDRDDANLLATVIQCRRPPGDKGSDQVDWPQTRFSTYGIQGAKGGMRVASAARCRSFCTKPAYPCAVLSQPRSRHRRPARHTAAGPRLG